MEEAFKYFRMNIAASADCRSVAEMLRHPFDGTNDRALARCIVVDMLELAQGERRKVSPGPGSKILRSDFLSRDFVEIRIHLGRGNAVTLATIVEKLKDLIAPEYPARPC